MIKHSKKKEILDSIFRRTAGSIKLGLDNITKAAEASGNPQEHYPSVHVAGTNGKGSVCSYIESMLRSAGKKTGLYTSPHIIDFEERFRINGTPVDPCEWISVYEDLKNIIYENNLTFFEISTLLAFEIFRRNKVQWAVIETGLGGRLDATNIIRPKISVITNISYDHKEYLGETLPEIAEEKLGIIKKNTPVIMMRSFHEDINRSSLKRCKIKGCEIEFVSETEIKKYQHAEYIQHKGINIRIPLAGSHQKLNALCALKAFDRINAGSPDDAAAGIENTRLSARFEVVRLDNRSVVFDAAHNSDSSEKLCETLTELFDKKDICIVAGIMKNKDYEKMITCYSGCCAMIIITAPQTERSITPPTLYNAIPDSFKGMKSLSTSVADAVEKAFQSEYRIICVTGSFFTVGEAMKHLNLRVCSSGF